jgi:hypothetical protein
MPVNGQMERVKICTVKKKRIRGFTAEAEFWHSSCDGRNQCIATGSGKEHGVGNQVSRSSGDIDATVVSEGGAGQRATTPLDHRTVIRAMIKSFSTTCLGGSSPSYITCSSEHSSNMQYGPTTCYSYRWIPLRRRTGSLGRAHST